MKNTKRIIALILAIATIFSVMAVSVSARQVGDRSRNSTSIFTKMALATSILYGICDTIYEKSQRRHISIADRDGNQNGLVLSQLLGNVGDIMQAVGMNILGNFGFFEGNDFADYLFKEWDIYNPLIRKHVTPEYASF